MDHAALIWLELGGVLALLAVMARLARRVALSPIPLYLAAGLALGEGGLVPLVTSQEFVEIGAELGVILLLLMLGLEYTGQELVGNLRRSAPVGVADLVLNFLPGFAAGLLLDLGTTPSLFLGGVTYISSSGIVAKVLGDLDWTANRETPIILSVLVFEDLAMAVMLPVLGAVALGGTVPTALVSVAIALAAVGIVLTVSVRYGERISRLAFSDSDEVHLLTVLGITLLVGAICFFCDGRRRRQGAGSSAAWPERPRFRSTAGALALFGLFLSNLAGMPVLLYANDLWEPRTSNSLLPLQPIGLLFSLLLVRPSERERARRKNKAMFSAAGFCWYPDTRICVATHSSRSRLRTSRVAPPKAAPHMEGGCRLRKSFAGGVCTWESFAGVVCTWRERREAFALPGDDAAARSETRDRACGVRATSG